MIQDDVDLDFTKTCSSLLTVGARSSLLLTVAHCLLKMDSILRYLQINKQMMTILNLPM